MGDITDMDLRQMIGEKMSKEMDKNIEVVEKIDNGVIVFDKPYNWEGKEYTSVDISNMEHLKGIDLIESLDNGNGLSTSVNGEYNLKTIMSLVSKAKGIPVEFFEYLPIKEVIKIKYKAISFL